MTAAPVHDRVLIVDFGSQVTQLIARRLREQGLSYEKIAARMGKPRTTVTGWFK